MIRLLSVAAAVATSAMLLSATSAHAQTGYYVAVPEAKVTQTRLMTRSTPWAVRDGALVAARAPERDAVLCQLVAKDVGRLSSFSAGGKAFDADALEKCNARAAGANVKMAKAN